jgi:hypothetical protein
MAGSKIENARWRFVSMDLGQSFSIANQCPPSFLKLKRKLGELKDKAGAIHSVRKPIHHAACLL